MVADVYFRRLNKIWGMIICLLGLHGGAGWPPSFCWYLFCPCALLASHLCRRWPYAIPTTLWFCCIFHAIHLAVQDSTFSLAIFRDLSWLGTLQVVYGLTRFFHSYCSTIFTKCNNRYAFQSELILNSFFLVTNPLCSFIFFKIIEIVLRCLTVIDRRCGLWLGETAEVKTSRRGIFFDYWWDTCLVGKSWLCLFCAELNVWRLIFSYLRRTIIPIGKEILHWQDNVSILISIQIHF